MKNLIVLLVLFSFVFVPFNTNAGNIDYSKTEIKVSGKNYTLIKVKDLLYKNITNKVNEKQTESLKIDSYNSFIKTLDKISKEAQKSKKTQNIHLGYMIEDLKILLKTDLEKITNKVSQIEDKKEVLENTNIEEIKTKYQNSIGNITLASNFEILESPYIPGDGYLNIPGLEQALINLKTKDITSDSITLKVKGYAGTINGVKFNMADVLGDVIKINKSYFSNPTFSFDYVNPLLTNINIDKNELKSVRAFVSDEGKSKLISVKFIGQKMNYNTIPFKLDYGDYSNIDILETYENGRALIYGKNGVIYNEGVKISSDFKIETSLDRDINVYGDGKLSVETSTILGKQTFSQIRDLYVNQTKKYYNGTIAFDFAPTEIIDRKENKLIEGVNIETIKKQRIESSENGKSKLIKVIINFTIDGMGIEVIEHYENGNSFGFGWSGRGYTEVKTRVKFREVEARVTKVNNKILPFSY